MSRELKYNGMIAPCGMNCGQCIEHLRDKRPCGGCFRMDERSLRRFRLFYLYYPHLALPIRGTVTPELKDIEKGDTVPRF